MIITIGRKPFKGALVGNILDNECGGINIDQTRIQFETDGKRKETQRSKREDDRLWAEGQSGMKNENSLYADADPKGRFPANVLLSEGTTSIMDDQSGISRSPKTYVRNADGFNNGVCSDKKMIGEKAGSVSLNFGDEGGASRYFKVIK